MINFVERVVKIINEQMSLFMLQHVVFNIVNFSKKRICFRDGMTPLVRSTSRPKW